MTEARGFQRGEIDAMILAAFLAGGREDAALLEVDELHDHDPRAAMVWPFDDRHLNRFLGRAIGDDADETAGPANLA